MPLPPFRWPLERSAHKKGPAKGEASVPVSGKPEPIAPEPEAPPEQQMREVFETFRSAIEDEF